jgi:predicted Fe-Mo cluster-binding NifX family protein
MRICVSASANSLDASVDPRFGRCPYFIIVDSETLQFEAVPNPASGAVGGAGIQAAQIIASKGAKVVITGNVGPNAFQALSAAGIKIITGAYGTVRELLKNIGGESLKRRVLQLLEGILEWEWAEGVVGGEGNGSHGRCRG